jgi:hypothetical protein
LCRLVRRFTIWGLVVSGRDIIEEKFCGMIKSLTAVRRNTPPEGNLARAAS